MSHKASENSINDERRKIKEKKQSNKHVTEEEESRNVTNWHCVQKKTGILTSGP